ncbi:MAG: ABC transporter ATP-binding protein [Myxococcota bacterium]
MRWLRRRRRTPEASPRPEGGPALEVRDLALAFGDTEAVRGLSLSVDPGELYGLVGPDGAGKTTAIRLMTGLLEADAGRVAILGEEVVAGRSGTRESVGYMPQQYSLYGDLSVHENLTFFGRLFGLSRAEIDLRRQRLLAITRLERFGDRRADALSGGMYKKLALACALLHRPAVLILDEPSNGVDPVSRRELWDLLYEFVADGMAVLLATPYMDEAERCHRVGLVHGGALLAEGPPDDLIAGFPHETLLLRSSDRDRTELSLEGAGEVLALSPRGAAVRVVIREGAGEAFRRRLGDLEPPVEVEPTLPDFEDVYLGLVAGADRGEVAHG